MKRIASDPSSRLIGVLFIALVLTVTGLVIYAALQ